ncbi:MAG: ATP-binding cassette domain-containing protein [Rhodobacterales bacterium]|nr:ATP-binding cassette domain-containing protein [Rhodobacterales bacterium]
MSNPSASVGVRLEGVTKSFGDTAVLKGIDLAMAPGTLTTLLGPSGCGKTTILRLVAGLEMPTTGRILIGDEDVSLLSASHRDVAMVFQSYALFPHMTVGENVSYGLKVQGVGKEERHARAEAAMASVGLAGYGGRYIDQLSGGQQQRIAVARALILEPKVMLFDEPLSNLDSKLRRQMREDIRRLQQDTGITSVYVTHDQEEALSVSDEVVVISEGAIAQKGTPKHLYRRPVSPFVATFMGDANITTGRVRDLDGVMVVEIDGLRVPIEDAEGLAGERQVALRPESLNLKDIGPGLRGTVRSHAYVGAATEYWVQWGDHELFAIMPASTREFPVGAQVYVDIDPVGVAVIG